MGHVILCGGGGKREAAIPAVLANATPEQIQAAARSGKASNVWAVGDTVPITLNGTVGALALNDTYYAFIIDFNHNSIVEGNNTIHFQFGKTSAGVNIAFCDSNYNTIGSTAGFRMNTTNTNSGGWNSSYMRNTILPAFLAAMPAAWQNVITACTKYSDNTGGGSGAASCVTASSENLFLLAEFEAFGARSSANSAEQNYQKQYKYYADGNSKVKYRHDATGTAVWWWLRSVAATHAYNFLNTTTVGTRDAHSPYYSGGLAPGFMVA